MTRKRSDLDLFEDLPSEVWRAVPTTPGHDVSNLGRVRSWRGPFGVKRRVPRLRKPSINLTEGVPMLVYFDLEARKHVGRTVHSLVAEVFIGPRPDGLEIRHLDGDNMNNRVENLAYGTHRENERDKIRHGTSQHGENNHQCKLTRKQVAAIRRSKELLRVLAARYGVWESQISRIRNGVRRARG